MPGKIFVNYRRDDARDMAARIRDRLAATFGDANVFMDVDNLLAGQRFDRELEKALGQTDVFLAVIGPRWVELLAERRKSGERDYVREEIAGALQRGIVVIPALVERTLLPHHEALAQDIRDLVLHQKHVVTHERFGRDIEDLVEAIRFARTVARAEAGGGKATVRWVAAAAVAALVLAGGVLAYQVGTPDGGGESKRQEDRAKAAPDAKAKREEEIKVAAEAAAAKKAEEEAQAKRVAEEAEGQRLAALKAEQDRKLTEEAQKKLAITVVPGITLNYPTSPLEKETSAMAELVKKFEQYQRWDCVQQENPDLSVRACTYIIGRDSEGAWAYYNRGVGYVKKGDYDRAIVDFTKAIEINPEHVLTFSNRGYAYERLGRRADAIADYRRALAIEPNNQYSMDALRRLGASP